MARVFDLHNNCYAEVGKTIAAITTNTTTNGAIIDTKDFEALEFVFLSATITDGDYALSLQHGDQSDLSDAEAVSTEETLGAGAAFAAADDNEVKRLGYIGKKRYVRASIVSTGVSTGGTIGAVAVLARPKHAPTDAN